MIVVELILCTRMGLLDDKVYHFVAKYLFEIVLIRCIFYVHWCFTERMTTPATNCAPQAQTELGAGCKSNFTIA